MIFIAVASSKSHAKLFLILLTDLPHGPLHFKTLLIAFEVSLYSLSLNALIAFSGKYLSPVFDDFLPDFVVHFWSPQSLRSFCDFVFLDDL